MAGGYTYEAKEVKIARDMLKALNVYLKANVITNSAYDKKGGHGHHPGSILVANPTISECMQCCMFYRSLIAIIMIHVVHHPSLKINTTLATTMSCHYLVTIH